MSLSWAIGVGGAAGLIDHNRSALVDVKDILPLPRCPPGILDIQDGSVNRFISRAGELFFDEFRRALKGSAF